METRKLYFAAHEWNENESVLVIHFYAESIIQALEKAEGLFRRAYELPDLNFNEMDSGILTVDEVEIYD